MSQRAWIVSALLDMVRTPGGDTRARPDSGMNEREAAATAKVSKGSIRDAKFVPDGGLRRAPAPVGVCVPQAVQYGL